MTDAVKMAIEALTDIRTSIECAAGCDEGIDPLAAVSEIMSAYGTAMSSAYSRAADMVNILAAIEQAGEPVDENKLAAEDMRQTAKELRDNSNGNPSVVQEAMYWDRKADAIDPPLATLQRLGKEFDGEGEVDRIAAAIHESDPDVGCTWSEWVAYAEAHPHHMQQVEYVRRQAQAVAALSSAKRGEG